MSLIDTLEQVKDKDSFIRFAAELAKEKSKKAIAPANELNSRDIENYVRTVLAWADAQATFQVPSASPASHWRKAATSIYCRR